MEPNLRVFVAGHRGLIGSAFVRRLRVDGCADLVVRERAELDLTDGERVGRFFDEVRPELVVLAAGRVGGIAENQRCPADLLTENLAIELNVVRAAHASGAKRLLFFGSSCMFPRDCPQPMPEEALLSGRPEPTSLPYAVAKLAGVQLCLAYNAQHGDGRFLPVIPCSVYGPGDDFDPGTAHVLSALIARFHAAKVDGAPRVTLWGSGEPRREFVFVDDLVSACLVLLDSGVGNASLPVNVGTGEEVSVRELAALVAEVVGFRGEVAWDAGKPDGAPRKLLGGARMAALGWSAAVPLAEGVRRTYAWYVRSLRAREG